MGVVVRSSIRGAITVDEAAAFLGVDRNTAYEYTTRGVIRHPRLGSASCCGAVR